MAVSSQELNWIEDENPRHKLPHRSIAYSIKRYLPPKEIYESLTKPDRYWPYKKDALSFVQRDQAMIALSYLGVLRISEEVGITRAQLEFQPDRQRWLISGVRLGKARGSKGTNPQAWRERHEKWREVWLPLPKKAQNPWRIALTKMFVNYAQTIEPETRLFALGRKRAWAIFENQTGAWPHYFRACGMRYLYDAWEHDLAAVCKYVKISERTALRYLGSFEHGAV